MIRAKNKKNIFLLGVPKVLSEGVNIDFPKKNWYGYPQPKVEKSQEISGMGFKNIFQKTVGEVDSIPPPLIGNWFIIVLYVQEVLKFIIYNIMHMAHVFRHFFYEIQTFEVLDVFKAFLWPRSRTITSHVWQEVFQIFDNIHNAHVYGQILRRNRLL